ncbi:MAG: surface-adhesin E family protein [Candidatus Gastranaerophilaceae bacterium]
MKKTLTFIIFFCFISIQIAFAANWVPVFLNNQRKVYLDTVNLQVNGNISTYWIKYISEGFTYKLYLSSDCSNNEISTLQFLKYNSSDELIYSNKNETGYNKVVPGTIEEDIHKRVCSGNPYKKFVNDSSNIYVNSLSNDIGTLNNGTTVNEYNDIDIAPYMREIQRRIKMNWDPPKGNESKRVAEEDLINDKNFFVSDEEREKFSKDKINVHYIRLKPVKYFDEYINGKLTYKKLQENGCAETLFRQINLDKDFPQLLNYIRNILAT